jgi:predicted RecA/RadA family phage recombinase
MPSSGRTPLLGLTFTSDAAMNDNLLRIERAVSDARSIVSSSVTSPTHCVAGDGFIQGGLFCVALSDAAPNDLVEAQITGVAAVKKAVGSSDAYAPGDPVLVDENAHAALAGTARIGTAVAVSGGSETTVRTLLQPGLV